MFLDDIKVGQAYEVAKDYDEQDCEGFVGVAVAFGAGDLVNLKDSAGMVIYAPASHLISTPANDPQNGS